MQNYDDFLKSLSAAGFSMGGGNSEGIYSLVCWDWNETPPYPTPVAWHTGDRETDPWEWRMRVLDEGKEIAYGKFFFKKSGYITKEWFPFFLACRRGGKTALQAYEASTLSKTAKIIYDLIEEYETLPLHGIKALGSFGKEQKSAFGRALVELQMSLYITMCGKQQKLSQKGEFYGWASTMFCKTETFWDESVFNRVKSITAKEAEEKIKAQVLKLNPNGIEKKIKKFIYG